MTYFVCLMKVPQSAERQHKSEGHMAEAEAKCIYTVGELLDLASSPLVTVPEDLNVVEIEQIHIQRSQQLTQTGREKSFSHSGHDHRNNTRKGGKGGWKSSRELHRDGPREGPREHHNTHKDQAQKANKPPDTAIEESDNLWLAPDAGSSGFGGGGDHVAEFEKWKSEMKNSALRDAGFEVNASHRTEIANEEPRGGGNVRIASELEYWQTGIPAVPKQPTSENIGVSSRFFSLKETPQNFGFPPGVVGGVPVSSGGMPQPSQNHPMSSVSTIATPSAQPKGFASGSNLANPVSSRNPGPPPGLNLGAAPKGITPPPGLQQFNGFNPPPGLHPPPGLQTASGLHPPPGIHVPPSLQPPPGLAPQKQRNSYAPPPISGVVDYRGPAPAISNSKPNQSQARGSLALDGVATQAKQVNPNTTSDDAFFKSLLSRKS